MSKKYLSYIYGLLLCVVISGVAILLSDFIPLGAVAIAIVIGIVVGNIFKPNENFEKGIAFSEKHILSLAIALMGVKLNFNILKELGYKSIFLVVVALTLTLIFSYVLSKIFKFDKKFALLIGIGNGVCGSSAIAATEKIIGVKKEEVGLSIAIVNFLGTIGIFLLPIIATVMLKLTELNAGILIGNTLQAVGQVVAAGFSIGEAAGQTATIVKMTRVLMLFPLVFVLILMFSKKEKSSSKKIKKPAIPLFIIGFVVFSFIPTFNLMPTGLIKMIGKISHYSLIIAMSAIGLRITVGTILKDGKSALIIGSIIFLFQIVVSGSVILLLF